MLTLSVQNLSYGYTALPLFENLSFQVSAGEILHLKGPNGAGKSTLMQVLAGLIKPKSGDILWRHGQMVVDNPASYREYLPAEANGLYGKLDAMANLAFWLRLRGRIATEKELVGALEQWNLAHPLLRMNFPVEKFSTGMKRRLALARVNLASVPGWLLDEPLYGLDDNGVATLRRALRAHCEDGGLAVVVSHDMEALQGLPVRTLTLGAVA